ncbi:MAG: hypothetical protein KF786_10640, partial [Burkholderiaceae bacterium]|nr:hypothetical protein [Burkholderiaceae bacterium]
QAQAQDPVGSDAKPAAVAKTRSRAAPAATGKAASGARAPAARKRTTTHGKLALVGATHPARKRRA